MKNNNELGAALATVGLSEAQVAANKAAAELAEQQAHWKSLLATQLARNPNACQGRVNAGRFSFRHCNNKAKFHREERVAYDAQSPVAIHHYCSLHDEVSKSEKRRVEQDARIRANNAHWKRQSEQNERAELLAKFAINLTNEQLGRLYTFDPDVLNTAFNDFLREDATVKATMEVK
jgi:hypothetical protein